MTKQSENSIQSERRKRFLDHPGFLTRLAQRRSTSIFAEVFRDEDFTATQHMTLVAIRETCPTSQRRLSNYRSMEPSNLHAVLKKLAQRNLIDIGVDPTNKRRSRIDLTSKGRQLLSRTDSLDKAVSRLYLSPLTSKEQERFKQLLYKVAFNGRDPGPE